jgi:hypothetical protein
MTWQASETILGAGTHKAGMDASKLLTSHKGVGLLLGADGETELSAGDAVTMQTTCCTSPPSVPRANAVGYCVSRLGR